MEDPTNQSPARQPAIPMILNCPGCAARHIDEGDFATTKLHHTHSCQHCGVTWRPALANTVGVPFLPGFKDPTGHVLEQIMDERKAQDAQWGGPDHDDEKDCEEWIVIAEIQLEKASSFIGAGEEIDNPDAEYRKALLDTAAVCVAAIESLDRHHERHNKTIRRDGNLKEVGSCSDTCPECFMNIHCKPACTTQTYPIAPD